MAAISTDPILAKITTPATSKRNRSREEVFSSALESYIASYRKRHAAPMKSHAVGVVPSSPWFFPRLMN